MPSYPMMKSAKYTTSMARMDSMLWNEASIQKRRALVEAEAFREEEAFQEVVLVVVIHSFTFQEVDREDILMPFACLKKCLVVLVVAGVVTLVVAAAAAAFRVVVPLVALDNNNSNSNKPQSYFQKMERWCDWVNQSFPTSPASTCG